MRPRRAVSARGRGLGGGELLSERGDFQAAGGCEGVRGRIAEGAAGVGSLTLAATGAGWEGAAGVGSLTLAATGAAARFFGGLGDGFPRFADAQSGSPMATCEPPGRRFSAARRCKALQLHRGLVGLDLGEAVAALHGVALGFSHLTSVPTVMVSLSFGISMIGTWGGNWLLLMVMAIGSLQSVRGTRGWAIHQ